MGWEKIDSVETFAGQISNKPRVKIFNREDLIKIGSRHNKQ